MAVLLMLLSCAQAECISPTTGRALPAEPVAPVIASVSNGRQAPWGVELADIVYETPMAPGDHTRFAFVFHDALLTEESIHTGPVRSPRETHAILMKEWHAGLIANGSVRGNRAAAPGLKDNDGWFLNTYQGRGRACASRLKGRKAPNNMDVDVLAVHRALGDPPALADGFAFADAAQALRPVEHIRLIWPHNTADFYYKDGEYCREGWEGGFANVIVQMVDGVMPVQGEGEAVVYMRGQRIPARWKKESAGEKTFFLTENGAILTICTGRTFIAHLPVQFGKLEYQ